MRLRQDSSSKLKLSYTLRSWLPILQADIESLEEILKSFKENNPYIEVKSGFESREEKYINYLYDNKKSGFGNAIELFNIYEKTLEEFLYEQIVPPLFPTPKSQNIAYKIIENINHEGYYEGDDKKIAAEFGICIKEIEKVRKRFAHLEPGGIGAKDINESFLFQLEDFELENELEKFVSKRGLSLNDFKDFLSQKGVDWQKYKEQFKKQLLKKKFFKKIASAKLTKPEDDEIYEYYKKNITEFSMPKYVEVVKYISSDKRALQKIITNPMVSIPTVQTGEEKVELSKIGPQLAFLLKDTKEGKFTPILPFKNQFLTMYVKKKIDIEPLPFEEVKNAVIAKMIEEKKEKAIKNYLAKLKVNAKIKVLRLP